ncbi:MAG: hypothetical protein R3C03_20910 [Pirellulaceae bacterium]
MSFVRTIYLASVVIAAVLSPYCATVLQADEIPLGHVEKSIAVVVRDNMVRIEYQIGMNPADIRDWCGEQAIDVANADTSELLAAFAEGVKTVGDELISIQLDDQDVSPIVAGARAGGQHHVSAVVVFEFEIETAADSLTQHSLKVFDQSFKGMDGAIRLAAKCQGNAMLRSSNVKPIIVRADRVDFSELSEDERIEKTTIQTDILIRGQPSKTDQNSETESGK